MMDSSTAGRWQRSTAPHSWVPAAGGLTGMSAARAPPGATCPRSPGGSGSDSGATDSRLPVLRPRRPLRGGIHLKMVADGVNSCGSPYLRKAHGLCNWPATGCCACHQWGLQRARRLFRWSGLMKRLKEIRATPVTFCRQEGLVAHALLKQPCPPLQPADSAADAIDDRSF